MAAHLKSCFRAGFCLAAGVFLGIFLTLSAAAGLVCFLPSLLVLEAEPVGADAAVVLGGGGGERLRRAVDLHDRRLVSQLILVGQKRGEWEHIIRHLCRECDLSGRRSAILVGSKNTETDAELALEHCRKSGIQSVVVITDPYHTRRAATIFGRIFRGSGIRCTMISSGDFGDLVAPDGPFWKDRRTLETVWLEFGKLIYQFILPMPSI